VGFACFAQLCSDFTTGIAMSKDPLALSVFTTGSHHDSEYDAVYAAVSATERGRWFLTEFANRHRHADTDSLMAALARIEAGVNGGGAQRPSTAVGQELKALAALVAQIRTMLGSDTAGAVERVHDIAFSLRERAFDAELCNTLDASLRDMSADRSRELIDDLAARLDKLIKLSSTGETGGEGTPTFETNLVQPSVAVRAEATESERDDGASLRLDPAVIEFSARRKSAPVASLALSLADAASAIAPQSEALSSVMPALEPDETELPEPQAEMSISDVPRWHIEAPDFFFQAAASPETADRAEPVIDAIRPHALLPAAEMAPEPNDDPADLFEVAVPFAETPVPPQSANGADSNTVTPPSYGDKLRQAPSDSFAALRRLSEDELNALFG
jgi:hypothetical protein